MLTGSLPDAADEDPLLGCGKCFHRFDLDSKDPGSHRDATSGPHHECDRRQRDLVILHLCRRDVRQRFRWCDPNGWSPAKYITDMTRFAWFSYFPVPPFPSLLAFAFLYANLTHVV